MDTTELSIAAIAAEPREFSGLLAHATRVEAVRTRASYACRARIGGRAWVLVADGPGPLRAAAAARVALELGPVSAMVSTGFCGGLDPALKVGDVFVADDVMGEGDRHWAARAAGAGGGTTPSGRLLSRDRVVISADEKSALYRTLGARAVEMEAAAVAQAAEDEGVPFYCVRVVSDSASDTLPLDFNLYRSPSGRFSRGRIIGAALARPWSFRGLMRLNADSLRATRSLGDFLVHCSF
jgi:adenosylhomocysteine nucleosidase